MEGEESLPKSLITVCICTYKRPELLSRLLTALDAQETQNKFQYSIVVVDNDSGESGKGVVTDFARTHRIEVHYDVEPRQNIAMARNKALANAKGDFIAFIDDDEFPVSGWLLTLFDACHKYQADGVLGPVIPHFEQTPPRWVTRGGFFDRPRHETGFFIDWTEGRTGNLLFRRKILKGIGDPFKPEFGSGGEDRNFFMRVTAKGCRFVWCDEAVAYEVVPPIRWDRNFMLRRALLRGKMSLQHDNAGLGEVAKSMLAVPLYTLALPVLLLMGYHKFMELPDQTVPITWDASSLCSEQTR